MPPTVSLTEVAPQPTVVIPLVTTWAEYPSQWGPLLGEVWEAIHAHDIRAGRNIMLYRDDRPSVEVGAELLGPFTPTGRVTVSQLPTGPALTTTGAHTPEGIAEAHERIHAFAKANDHPLTRTRFEIYSHHDPDPAKMHVEVTYLLQPTRRAT